MEKKSKSYPLNFFKNKKIVITGINGFKGFWLYLLLDNLGAKVSGIGLKSRNYPILNKFKFKKKLFDNIDINNFAGLGLPWLLGAIYWEYTDPVMGFQVNSLSLNFQVSI